MQHQYTKYAIIGAGPIGAGFTGVGLVATGLIGAGPTGRCGIPKQGNSNLRKTVVTHLAVLQCIVSFLSPSLRPSSTKHFGRPISDVLGGATCNYTGSY